MPKCPNCGREIDHLVNYTSGIIDVFKFQIDDGGNPEYKYLDTLSSRDETEWWACPECDYTIAKGEDEAVAFLKGAKIWRCQNCGEPLNLEGSQITEEELAILEREGKLLCYGCEHGLKE